MHNDPHMREIAHGTMLAFILRFIGAGIAFLLNVVIAHLLGAEGAGIYFLALAIATIASVVGRLGLDSALLRFIAIGATHKDWHRIMSAYVLGMRMAFFASGITTMTIFIGAPWIANGLFDNQGLVEPLRWMSLSILPFAILNLQAESLKGLKKISDSMLVQGIGVPLVALLLIYPLAYVYGITGVVLAYTTATIVLTFIGGRLWRKSSPIHEMASFPSELRTELWQSCKPLWMVSIINRALIPWAPLLVLGMFSSTKDVGIFSAAFRIAMLINLMMTTVNSILAPKFAEIYTKGDLISLGSMARRTAIMMTIFSSPVFIILFIFSGEIMSIYGSEFREGAILLIVLSVGQFVNVATGSVGLLLVMTGNEKKFNSINTIAFLLQILMLVLLSPLLGALGASIAASLSVIFVNILAAIAVFKLVGIQVVPFIK